MLFSDFYCLINCQLIVSGNALITIKNANLRGVLNEHEIWSITEAEILPYKKTTLHLTEKQVPSKI